VRSLIVVTGTGTEIGKTHTTCALLVAARGRGFGVKPIESGVIGDEGDDGRALRLASGPTFHVKHAPAPYLFRRAVSPHLAARDEGRAIDPDVAAAAVLRTPDDAEAVLVELPGGLFSPLGAAATNADLALRLRPDALLLVAPDRLGVLHDVGATLRAVSAAGLTATAVAVVRPAQPDLSTGTNAAELRLLGAPPVFEIPRGTVEALGALPELRALYEVLLGSRVT
jgi:dethiobiotin synthetase